MKRLRDELESKSQEGKLTLTKQDHKEAIKALTEKRKPNYVRKK